MFNWGISEEKIARWQEEKNANKLAKAACAGKGNISAKAATALLSLADPTALRLAENLLSDSNEEVQSIAAHGFRRLHYEPSSDDARLALAFILRDRDALLAMQDKAHSYLAKTLVKPETEAAAFAAEILQAGGWNPANDTEKTRFLLARREFQLIPAIGFRAFPILDEYCSRQHEVPLRRRAFTALVEAGGSAALPYLEKYSKDSDEEISSLALAHKEEIKRREFVETRASKWQSFFRSPASNATENNATQFIHLGMEYLEHGLLYEAYCALAVADYIYEQLMGGYFIRDGLRMSDLHTQREREIKVFGDFKLEGVLEQISERIRGKKEKSTLLSLLLSGARQDAELSTESLKLKQILAGTQVYDPAFLEATINFLLAHDNDSRRAWRAIVHLPDKRVIPSLIDTFKLSEFVFDPIQSLIYIGEDAVPELMKELKKDDYKCRANAAFALGFLGEQNIKAEMIAALQKETVPMVQTTLHFALARMGEEDGHVDFLFDRLKDQDEAVARQAARCIHHLKTGVQASRLLPFVDHPDASVRIHIVGTFANLEKPLAAEVLDKLVNRLLVEKDKDVLDKLVSVLSEFKGDEQLVKMLLQRLPKAPTDRQEKIVSILGNLRAPESIEALLALWPNTNTDLRRSLIWSLGQLGAVQSLEQLSKTLRQNEQLRRVAAFGMLMLSDANREAVVTELRRAQNSEARMALAMLGEKDAIDQIRGGLNPFNDIQQIFEGLDAAGLVHHADFVKPLRSLLEFSNQNYYPTDRYVRHSAVEALAKTLLANQAS
ncbi:MAG: HEAT repeat domain-containing protein [candidate division KSB1 bacterium]|nr:HEAT repeat domain-containing protein [candidate division KSB1 bacterium]MDZ7301177.1 HEAT repeat domain-containing protein [candidate division KSB1 bacterium]MDZ7310599.1 HEAT repeat domain-containing protein [candidate division KSB1 bacterium]